MDIYLPVVVVLLLFAAALAASWLALRRRTARLGAELRAMLGAVPQKDITVELASRGDCRIVRFCDFFSSYSVFEEDIGQLPEGAIVLFKSRSKCIASVGIVEDIVGKLPARDELFRVFSAWRALAHRGNVAYLRGPKARLSELKREDLEAAARFLSGLGRRLSPSWTGGRFTVRDGFRPRPYAWNWNGEDFRAAMDWKLSSVCFSYYVEGPYLNAPIIGLLNRTAGGARPIWVFRKNLSPGPVASKFSVPFRSGILGSADPDILMSLDWLDEGSFTAFAVPKSGRERDIERLVAATPDHSLFSAMIQNFGNLDLLCRRLYDWEASWYSGEYELISGRDLTGEVAAALSELSDRFGAGVERLAEPFHVKLFAGDRFERSSA